MNGFRGSKAIALANPPQKVCGFVVRLLVHTNAIEMSTIEYCFGFIWFESRGDSMQERDLKARYKSSCIVASKVTEQAAILVQPVEVGGCPIPRGTRKTSVFPCFSSKIREMPGFAGLGRNKVPELHSFVCRRLCWRLKRRPRVDLLRGNWSSLMLRGAGIFDWLKVRKRFLQINCGFNMQAFQADNRLIGGMGVTDWSIDRLVRPYARRLP